MENGKMKDTVINIRITSTEKKKLLKAFGSYANMRDFVLRLVDEEKGLRAGCASWETVTMVLLRSDLIITEILQGNIRKFHLSLYNNRQMLLRKQRGETK